MTELAKVDAHTARSVAGRIRQGIRDYLTSLALVKRAWDEEHWRALGYDSWQGYVDGEFGAERLGLPVEHRDKALNDLRLAGMSVRAIAAVTGVPKSSVADEVRRLSEAGQLEQPDTVRSLDGRERPATRPQTPATSPEPGPEGVGVAGPGHDLPSPDEDIAAGRTVQFGSVEEMDAALAAVHPQTPARQDTETTGSPAVATTGGPGRTVDPIDDPEFIAQQQREGSSDAVAEALVAVKMRLEPDPIRWFTETWIPGRYRFRDMPLVRDCFTPDGLRASAKHLELLADHLERTGGSL